MPDLDSSFVVVVLAIEETPFVTDCAYGGAETGWLGRFNLRDDLAYQSVSTDSPRKASWNVNMSWASLNL